MADLFTRPQTGPFTLTLLRQVLDQVAAGEVLTLTVSTGGDERVFFFTRGAVLFLALGTTGGETLARKLVAQGLFSWDQLGPLIERANADTPLLQDLLRNEGLMEADALNAVVEEIVEDHLLELALWDNALALYDLIPGNPPPRLYEKDVPAVRMSMGTKGLYARVRDKIAQESPAILSKLGGSLRNRIRPGAGSTDREVDPRVVAILADSVAETSGEAVSVQSIVVRACHQGIPPHLAAKTLAALASAGAAVIERVAEKDRRDDLGQAQVIEDSFEVFVNRLLARTHLAGIYERGNERDKAAEQYRGIAEEHLKRDALTDGLAALRQVLRLVPRDLGARELLVKVLQSAGRGADAAKEATDLGRILLELNLPGRARHAFDLALKLVPKNLSLLWMLGGLLELLGEKEAAVARYEEIAQLCEAAHDEPGRVAAYQQILELEPDHAEASRVVRALSGYRRALVARAGTVGVSGLLLLATLGYGGYELSSLAAYRKARDAAWAALDEGKFDVARSTVDEYARGFGLSRVAASSRALLLDRIDSEERLALEQQVARAERSARKLEAEGSTRQALAAWKSVAASADPARREAATQGVARCEKRVELAEQTVAEALALHKKALSKSGHDLLASLAKEEPWISGATFGPPGQEEIGLVPILVESVPPGARVTLEGSPEEKPTPVVILKPLRPGLKLRLDGRNREPLVRELEVLPPWPLTLSLPRHAAWRSPGTPSGRAPTVARELVVQGGPAWDLVAFARASGELRWRTPLGAFGEVEGAPLALEGRVAVRTRSGEVLALDVSSGKVLWRRDLAPPPFDPLDGASGRPLLAAGGILVREGPRGLVLLGAADGAVRWRAQAPADAVATPAVSADLVLLGCDRTLVTFRVADGKDAWLLSYPASAVTGPVVGPAGTIFVGLDRGQVLRADASGKLLSVAREIVDGGIGAPLDGDATRVLVGSPQGEVAALDANGKVVFRVFLELGQPVRWVRSVGPEQFLAGGSSLLFVFDKKGTELWRHPVANGGVPCWDELKLYQANPEGLTALDR